MSLGKTVTIDRTAIMKKFVVILVCNTIDSAATWWSVEISWSAMELYTLIALTQVICHFMECT